MTNEYEMADDNRADLICGKDKLLAPLQPGMQPPPHADGGGQHRRRLLPGQQVGSAEERSEDRDVDRAAAADAAGHTSTAEAVLFWVLGTVAVVGADRRGRRAQGGVLGDVSGHHDDLLAVLYIAQDALFLGVVQVVVYTGAVMMLFLFVLMLIGVDSVGIAGGNHSRTTRCGAWSPASGSAFC